MEGTSYKMNKDSGNDIQVVVIVDFDDGRLFPLTEESPKCLLPIANRKLLAYQLDLLKKSGAKDILMTTPEDYYEQTSMFIKSEYIEDSLNIEIIPVAEMMGSADALRAVTDKIRGDFIVFNTDIISQVSLGPLQNLHRLRTSDITMLLASVASDESDKKGGKRKVTIDEQDQEYIGLCSDGRVIMKTPALELDSEESTLTIQKALINLTNNFNLRNDLMDTGIYVMSHWILEFLKVNTKISVLRTELIPYMVDRQFQSAEYQIESIPGLCHRNRPLQALDSWLVGMKSVSHSSLLPVLQDPDTDSGYLSTASTSQTFHARPSGVLHSKTDDSILTSHSNTFDSQSNPFQISGEDSAPIGGHSDGIGPSSDLVRLFALVVDTGMESNPVLCQRIVSTQQYMNLNRDIPTIISSIGNASPWDPISRYQKKELSVIGDGCTVADKVTIKQCAVGVNCVISTKTKVNNCVIMDNVRIGECCVIQNSVICSGTIIENNCNLNECYVGCNATIPDGSRIKSDSISAGTSYCT